MRRFPAPIHNLVSSLTKLPGVGPKTALRYVFALLRLPALERERLARAVLDLARIETCTRCFRFSEASVCEICGDPARDKAVLCIVADSRDVSTIEATGVFKGLYFVLGGTLNPIEGIRPENLHVADLLSRLEREPSIREAIFGFSPDVHGETTMLYLTRALKEKGVKTTRLARGLPIGADIEYMDEVTLGDALLGRRET